jgi:uncharacterized protein DUF2827
MNVAISFGYSDKNTSVWDDDKIQNTLHLYFLLEKLKNINVYLINFGIFVNGLSEQSRFELGGIKLYSWSLIKDRVKFDIFIESGLKLKQDVIGILKNKNTKLILFNSYNKYLMDTEDILFNPNNKEILYDNYDEIWTLQNYQKMNKYYLEEVYNTTVYNMPNIWSSHIIDKEIKKLRKEGKKFEYHTNDKKNIVILQNNNNVNDISIYPLLIIEKSYKKDKDLFKNNIGHILLMNSDFLSSNKKFMSIINKLEIYKDNLVQMKGKYKIPNILSDSTDIIVSHQWDNSLNDYYLNALYGNYPILHNSDILKVNGYYYPDFNIQLASEKLIYIIQKHDKSQNNYFLKSRGIINNYDINNNNIKEVYYKRLLDLEKKINN